jgi:hypothetical protein
MLKLGLILTHWLVQVISRWSVVWPLILLLGVQTLLVLVTVRGFGLILIFLAIDAVTLYVQCRAWRRYR